MATGTGAHRGSRSRHSAWEVRLPLAEARHLTSPRGPLARGGRLGHGVIKHLGDGLIWLDALAFGHLSTLPDHVDGWVDCTIGPPILSIGGAGYHLCPS